MKKETRQLELPLLAKPILTLINGQRERTQEVLDNRGAVIRVLIEAGADLLLRRISPERAELIEQKVEELLVLFDRVDRQTETIVELQRQLDDLEALMRETRQVRVRRKI